MVVVFPDDLLELIREDNCYGLYEIIRGLLERNICDEDIILGRVAELRIQLHLRVSLYDMQVSLDDGALIRFVLC